MENEDREKRKIEEVQTTTTDKSTDNKQEQNKKPKVPITAPEITNENREEISRKVLKQVHYYFSDSNMNDKYLRGKISESTDGFVELSEITNFNRMKSICVDIPFIANLMKEKSDKVIIEGTRIKRATPWPTEDTSLQRTVFAKNIPAQWTLEEIEKFFETYGTVNRVFMLKQKDVFEGSVFVEFDTVEQYNKALEAKPMCEGKIVEISPKKPHDDKKGKKGKKNDKKAKEEVPAKDTYIKFSGIDTESNFTAIKELFKIHGNPWVVYEHKADHGFLKFKNEEEANEYLRRITEAKQEFNGKQLTYEMVDSEKISELIKPAEKMCVLKYTGIDPESNFNIIKDLFKLHGNPWVVYENKSDHGFLKFKSNDEADEYLKKITEAKQEFNGKELTYAKIEGEEEQKFINKYVNKGKGKGGKGGKGRKGFKGGKGRNKK